MVLLPLGTPLNISIRLVAVNCVIAACWFTLDSAKTLRLCGLMLLCLGVLANLNSIVEPELTE